MEKINNLSLLDRFGHVFEKELLTEIQQKASIATLEEGEVILDVGSIVRSIPIVLSGVIKISRIDEEGNELLLYYVSSNQGCALTFTCCMEQFPSEVKAVVEEEATLLMIPIGLMDEWMMRFTSWKSFVMKTIRSRFHELLKTLDQVAFQKLDERLVAYLKQKSEATNSKLINLSHEQIARDLATSRVVVSRLLKTLENEKRVVLYRNQIKLLSSL